MLSPTLPSRIRGTLFGVAICDALGGPVEFKARGTFPLITNLEPNSSFSLPAGCFTDDTSMTLCLAQSLIDRRGFDVQDQVHRVVPGRDAHLKGKGYRKPGSEVARAVTEEEQKMVDALFGKESYCGNGSLMRVVPIALGFYAVEIDKAIQYARLSSKVTHPHLRCQEACGLYTQLVVKVLRGSDKRDLVKTIAISNIQNEELGDRLSRYNTLASWVEQPENNIRSTGYVIDTLEAALWAFFTTATFEKGAIRVVNLGHDADTVGAVYGGLAGAFYGLDTIPTRWMEAMRNKDLLHEVSEGLQAVNGNAGIRGNSDMIE